MDMPTEPNRHSAVPRTSNDTAAKTEVSYERFFATTEMARGVFRLGNPPLRDQHSRSGEIGDGSAPVWDSESAGPSSIELEAAENAEADTVEGVNFDLKRTQVGQTTTWGPTATVEDIEYYVDLFLNQDLTYEDMVSRAQAMLGQSDAENFGALPISTLRSGFTAPSYPSV